MSSDPIIQTRYVGHYGRGHTRAFIGSGIPDVYYGEIREMPLSTYNQLPPGDWERIEKVCMMLDHNARICGKERVEGSHLCRFHLDEITRRGFLPSQSD